MMKKHYLTRKDNLPGLSLHKNRVVTFLGNEVYAEITPLYMNLRDKELIESIFKIRLVSKMLISFFAVRYIVSVWDC